MPWFARLWVIQEATISKVTPQMLWVSQLLSWEKKLSAAVWLETICYDCTPLSLLIASLALRALRLLDRLRRTGLPWDLTTMLNMSAYSKRSEPQDYIHSLVGLAGEAEETKPPQALQASYNKTFADVFRDLTQYIIETIGSLALLTCMSYTPAWESTPRGLRTLPEILNGKEYHILHDLDLTIARAGRVSRIPLKFRSWQLLRRSPNLGGRWHSCPESVDTITTVYEEMSNASLKSFGTQLLRLVNIAFEHTGAKYATIDTFARASW